MKSLLYLCTSILSTGMGCSCSKNSNEVYTPDFITKEKSILFYNRMEVTPFIWKNDRLIYMVSARDLGKIEIYESGKIISEFQSNLGLASAITKNGKLYIFGTTNWIKPLNSIYMIESLDLIHWSEAKVVIPSHPGRAYFNNSVAALPDGRFVMAYETCENGTVCFNSRFAISDDLIKWTETGSIFKPDEYAACPTIRFVDGYYYLFYLRSMGHFATFVSRSQDLIHWQESKKAVLSSLGTRDEGINNSDMDLIEQNGQVIINYADGDQKAWSDVRLARYRGTLENFVHEFFK